MTELGLAKLKSGKKLAAAPWKGATTNPELPADLKKAINADKNAKRIAEFVALTSGNERIGMK